MGSAIFSTFHILKNIVRVEKNTFYVRFINSYLNIFLCR